jgi:glutamate synthase (NADPH/NADH) small chain
MSAYAFEVAQARAADCRLIFEAIPREVLRNTEGNLTGVRFTHASSGTEWIEPCDQLLLAIGQPKQDHLLKSLFPALELNAIGCVLTDPLTAGTSLHKVFAGGDCANGGMEVVNAVGEGKKAAMAIHHMLTGKPTVPKLQTSRSGIARPAAGAGLWNPIRSATH